MNICLKQILCLHALHRSSGNARFLVSADTIRTPKKQIGLYTYNFYDTERREKEADDACHETIGRPNNMACQSIQIVENPTYQKTRRSEKHQRGE